MRTKIQKSAKDVLLRYNFYGQILRELNEIKLKGMSQLDLNNGKTVLNKIIKIIGEYSPKLLEEYDVIISYSNSPYIDYIIRMKKKK